MEDTASLPLITYRRLARGKERNPNSPYYVLLHDMPNPEHTSIVYREFIMGHLLGWGNHFSQKIWDNRGVLRELWPLRPDRMRVVRENGERKYIYTQANGVPRNFRQEEIWHIPAFGFDGLIGYSRISLARHAIGLSIAAEKFGSNFFKNGAVPGLAMKHPGTLSDNAYKHLMDSWNDTHGGVDNAHKPAILEEGMGIEKIGIPPDDAQFIETRRFQLGEIGRMFRVPPHMLGDVERSTSWGSGIEQQELGYLSHTLRPWLKRIEQGAQKDLLLESERQDTVIEHLVEDFLRTDIAGRMTAYVQAITNGIMTRNEARERENLLPYEGGDDPLVPLNMTTVNDQPDPNNDPNQTDLQTDPNAEGDPQPAKPKRDITPLLLDAAERILRREKNERDGAIERYLKKDKPERFSAWIEEFYKRDYPIFMQTVLNPLVQARFMANEWMKNFIQTYSDQRGKDMTDTLQGAIIAVPTVEDIASQLAGDTHGN
jgi:HK97 family phage portal protein